MTDILTAEQASRYPVYPHWCPHPVEISPVTACGLNIDYPKGLAWTRSYDLEQYSRRPYERWPPPCPVCGPLAADYLANNTPKSAITDSDQTPPAPAP